MSNKATLKDVGMAEYHLQTLKKYEEYFKKNPDNSFRLRCNINNEVLDIPINDIVKKEILKFFKQRKSLNQKILNDNPKLVKYLENH